MEWLNGLIAFIIIYIISTVQFIWHFITPSNFEERVELWLFMIFILIVCLATLVARSLEDKSKT